MFYLNGQWFRHGTPIKHKGRIPQRVCGVPHYWRPCLLAFTTNNAIWITTWKKFMPIDVLLP